MENTRTPKNKLHHDFCNYIIISWKLCLFLSYQHPMQRGLLEYSYIAPPPLLRTERLKTILAHLRIGQCRAVASLQKLGGTKILVSSLYLKSRGFSVRRSHQTGLCILKPENVSPSCRDIILSMLLDFFYSRILIFNFYTCMF